MALAPVSVPAFAAVSATVTVNGQVTGFPNHTGFPARTRSATSTDSPGSSFGATGRMSNLRSSPGWAGVNPTWTGRLPSLWTARR